MIKTFEKSKPSLEDVQKVIGGWVELVVIPNRPEIQMFANEDGRSLNMEVNLEASQVAGQTIVGPVVILKGDAKWD